MEEPFFDDKKLYQYYMIYDHTNYQDIHCGGPYDCRVNVGLPYVELKRFTEKEAYQFFRTCDEKFIRESVFTDKSAAYRQWCKLVKAKIKEIERWLNHGVKE